MNAAEDDQGIAVMCDLDGTVRSVVRDELGLAERVPPGASVLDLADPVDKEKAGTFLTNLQREGAAFGWEVTVHWQERLVSMHFGGGRVGDSLLIVVARTRNGMARLNDELMRINNDQMNALRSVSKALSLQSGGDVEVLEQLTQVNNELANLQRELAQKNRALATLNEQKNQLLGMAAHDLRSPLGVIVNYSQFLQEELGPQVSEEHQDFLGVIRSQSEFLLRLIDDILDVSQIESGELRLDLQRTDLEDLVRRNVALNRVLAEKKPILVSLVQDAGLAPFRLDAGKIEQVLNNLISNAIKFSHPGTEVTVRVERDGESVVVTVQDQGQGIPAEDLPKLFKPFGRTRVRSTAGEASTGLGLSIVRRIVEGHKGTVTVESTEGVGSTFRVRLPIAE